MTLLGIKKIDAHANGISIQFIPNPPIDPIVIIKMIQTNKYIQLNGQDRIKISPQQTDSFETLKQRIDVLKNLITTLSSPKKN